MFKVLNLALQYNPQLISSICYGSKECFTSLFMICHKKSHKGSKIPDLRPSGSKLSPTSNWLGNPFVRLQGEHPLPLLLPCSAYTTNAQPSWHYLSIKYPQNAKCSTYKLDITSEAMTINADKNNVWILDLEPELRISKISALGLEQDGIFNQSGPTVFGNPILSFNLLSML